MPLHRIALDGGVEILAEVQGAGPPIVLLHGFTGSASTMNGLAEPLAETHTVVAVNLIGHGESTGPADQYGVDAMAHQVIAAMDALGHPAPHDVVGYSMGGRVALTMACRAPAHVASLSVIGASAGLATAGERADREVADRELARSIVDDGLEEFVDRWMAHPLFATQARLGPRFLADAKVQRMTNDPAELVRSLLGAGAGTMRPLHGLLDRCALPAGLIVGADDPKFRQLAAELAAALPDAEVSVIEGAGHAAHLEQPELVVESIRATLTRGTTRVEPLSLPLRSPHTTGRGTTERRDSVLIGLRADGHTGWGEASPLPGWSSEDPGAVARLLTDRPPLALAMGVSAWDGTADQRSRLGLSPAARAAWAGAALDLDARRAERPLHRHLATWHPELEESTVLDALPVNALISEPDPEAVAAEARDHAAAGITAIKLKVGVLGPEADLERVAAARSAGPEMELRLDANGAWDHPTAVDFLSRAAAHGVVLCEEPVRGVESIARVGREVATPVAVDESIRAGVDFDAVLACARGIDALVVKPQALGGPDRAIDMIVAARRAGLDVIVTSMIDSAVGLAHAAHVAAACGLDVAHGLATARMLGSDVAPGMTVIGGRIEMPREPGLGVGLVSPRPFASP